MRVVLHHRTQGQGVEGVHLLGMARAFERAGALVEIVSPPGVVVGTPATAGAVAKRPRRGRRILGHLAARLPEIAFELLEIAYNVPAFLRLRRALRSPGRTPGADALYERYAFFNVAGALAARAAGVPFVLEVNYTTQTPLVRRRSRILRPIAEAAERFVLRRADVIACVSTTLARQAAALAPRARVLVVPNGADPDRFRAGISGEAVRKRLRLDGARVIGFTGAFVPWHGVHLMLDALPELARRVPAAVLLLIGDGPERTALEARARALGLAERVRFAGWVGHEHLPEHVAAFDVAVMPDSNDYGSPMKIFEYMAMGKPVVAPRLPPLEDGIKDGETGILFPPRDTGALRDAVASLLEDEPRRAAMGARARSHVLVEHTWDRNAERVLAGLRGPAPAAHPVAAAAGSR